MPVIAAWRASSTRSSHACISADRPRVRQDASSCRQTDACTRIHLELAGSLRRIPSVLPGGHISGADAFWYTADRPASVDAIIGWVHAATESIGADWVPGASHWIDGHPEWKAADNLH